MPSPFYRVTHVHRYVAHMRCSLPCAALHLACAVHRMQKPALALANASAASTPSGDLLQEYACTGCHVVLPALLTSCPCTLSHEEICNHHFDHCVDNPSKEALAFATTTLSSCRLPHFYSCLIACSFPAPYQSNQVGVCGWSTGGGAI
jgi:hypothetical protein